MAIEQAWGAFNTVAVVGNTVPILVGKNISTIVRAADSGPNAIYLVTFTDDLVNLLALILNTENVQGVSLTDRRTLRLVMDAPQINDDYVGFDVKTDADGSPGA